MLSLPVESASKLIELTLKALPKGIDHDTVSSALIDAATGTGKTSVQSIAKVSIETAERLALLNGNFVLIEPNEAAFREQLGSLSASGLLPSRDAAEVLVLQAAAILADLNDRENSEALVAIAHRVNP
jgi:hypothetical protein